jgi:glycosyltransferase involved in cell wall biosynthesis
MRILIVTQIFLPEMGALANRLYPIVRQLGAAGHEVSVATGMPNYPEGIVFPEYRGKRFLRERIDGCTVIRTAYFTTPRNQSKWTQLASYLSFIPAAVRSGLCAGKVDLVLVTSPPIFPVLPAIWLAKLRGARLVLDIRDLWPDELITYGGAREGSLPVRIIRVIERWGYRVADCVTCTTQSMLDIVVDRGVGREKTLLLPNGADLETFRKLPRENSIVNEYPFGDRFVVMYAGLFGIKHSLEVLLDAAHLLREQKDIVFFLIGNGARRDALKEQAWRLNLDNVIIAEERSVKDIPWLLARAGACFAAVRPEPYPQKVISVKVFEYWACEKPVVGALSGESARLLEESGGGFVVPPGDARATAESILTLYRNPELRATMGALGRRYVEQHYSRAAWAARLEETLRDMWLSDQERQVFKNAPESYHMESQAETKDVPL